jgi:hypothetical protein
MNIRVLDDSSNTLTGAVVALKLPMADCCNTRGTR